MQCLNKWATSVSAADIAAVATSIIGNTDSAAALGLPSGFGPLAVLATGTTNGTATVTSVTGTSGPPITQIQQGDLVLAPDIPLGTFVQSVASAGATVTLSQAATGSNSGENMIFARFRTAKFSENGLLEIPNRGIIKVLPQDVVAVDVTGFPYLIPQSAIGFAGSVWTFT